jgi:hypothetical protein
VAPGFRNSTGAGAEEPCHPGARVNSVDVTGIEDVQQDDEVVIVGRQKAEFIRAEDVAALADTINYEVTNSLLPRVTRVYLSAGEVVQIDSIDGD